MGEGAAFTPIRRIAIIGAGAIGGALASLFYEMDKESIALIADRDRYDRLVRDGLTVNGKLYHFPVFQPHAVPRPFDLIIFTVKHHHLSRAIEDVRQAVGGETLLLSLMNGIDSEERIGAAYGMEKVVYSMIIGINAVREGNSISYSSRWKIFFGEARNRSETPRVARIRELFERAGINYEVPDDMIRTIWWKFMINTGINQASAALRGNYGLFQTSDEARRLMESAMREVMVVAGKVGVSLSDRDIDDWYDVLSGLAPEGKTSMLQDVEAKRKTEVEMLAGKVIELGARHGVPTPVNEKLYTLLREMESRQAEK